MFSCRGLSRRIKKALKRPLQSGQIDQTIPAYLTASLERLSIYTSHKNVHPTMTANKAVAAHVNMMADTIIANLPVDGLRTVVRGILTSKSDMAAVLEEQTKEYLRETAARFSNAVVIQQLPDGSFQTTSLFDELQQRIRCSIGCGMCYQTLPLLQAIVDQAAPITLRPDQTQPDGNTFLSKVASVDADIVQAMTAVQKTLFVAEGTRDLTDAERQPMEALLRSLVDCRAKWEGKQQTFVFERGLDAVKGILNPAAADEATTKLPESLSEPPRSIGETFELAEGVRLPRIFNGLWQLSSPSWGAASRPKILEQLSHYVSNGLIAFDMADHYGDAEIVFVSCLLARPVPFLYARCRADTALLASTRSLCSLLQSIAFSIL